METNQRSGLRFSSGAFIHFPNPKGQSEVTLQVLDQAYLPESVDASMVTNIYFNLFEISFLVVLAYFEAMFTWHSIIMH